MKLLKGVKTQYASVTIIAHNWQYIYIYTPCLK